LVEGGTVVLVEEVDLVGVILEGTALSVGVVLIIIVEVTAAVGVVLLLVVGMVLLLVEDMVQG
jgi:hypothetical protein